MSIVPVDVQAACTTKSEVIPPLAVHVGVFLNPLPTVHEIGA
jgi:hypothetical protein